MHFFFLPDIDVQQPFLPEDEAKHALKVLRLKTGDKIKLTNGKGLLATAEIAEATTKTCNLKLVEIENIAQPQKQVHIAVAPTKNADRLEWFVEKATELGIAKITPIICVHSERKVLKTDRIEKIAIAAVKQSQQAWLPVIEQPIVFMEFVKQAQHENRFIAHCANGEKTALFQAAKSAKNVLVVIGPEGDFVDKEIDEALKLGFEPVSLGENRLRTETAALVALHTCLLA